MMSDPEAMKRLGDATATTATGAATAVTLTDMSTLAGHLTPILTAIVMMLTIVWWIWRAWDRVKYGPRRGGDE